MPLASLKLFSRKGCCLCEDAEAAALRMQEMGLCTLEVIDVDTSLELAARYGADVPVLLVDGVEALKHRVAPDELQLLLIRGKEEERRKDKELKPC